MKFKKIISLLLLLTLVAAQCDTPPCTDVSPDAAKENMAAAFKPVQDVLDTIGFKPLVAKPGSEEFQQFVGGAVLIYLFFGSVLPLEGLMRFFATLITMGVLSNSTTMQFDWFEFVFAFGPSLFVYYSMGDLLNFTLLSDNTRKLLSLFSMFVVYFFMSSYLVDFWKRLAVILQMSGWTLLLGSFVMMAIVRVFTFFLNKAAAKKGAS